jgi:hypothetical protein
MSACTDSGLAPKLEVEVDEAQPAASSLEVQLLVADVALEALQLVEFVADHDLLVETGVGCLAE